MTQITIISERTSPRLRYVLNWLFGTVLHTSYNIKAPGEENSSSFCVSYGAKGRGQLFIPDSGLLWQTGATPHEISTGEWEGIPTLYNSKEAEQGIPFDMFSAIFFLLSRYEEYYSYMPDKHDRYPPEQSLLFEKGWLLRPLVDEWIRKLCDILRKVHRLDIKTDPFRFTPTYDIDIAYSYKHKGWKRLTGATARDILMGNLKAVSDRISVAAGRAQDPYDCFDWLSTQHKKYDLHPIYFMLVSARTTVYDKNISPYAPEMQALIKRLVNEAETTLHPSYYSKDEKIFSEEKTLLEQLTEEKVVRSRQHYIRLQLPQTYRELIACGIREDFSMGYGSRLGFRAGTGRSFTWYDLERENETGLIVHPFCFMDSTAHFEEKLDTQQALELLLQMMDTLKRTSSHMITVFHNFSLGTDSEWIGWNTIYQRFLEKVFSR